MAFAAAVAVQPSNSSLEQKAATHEYIVSATVLAADSVLLVDSVEFKRQLANPGLIYEAGPTHYHLWHYRLVIDEHLKGAALADTVAIYSPIFGIEDRARLHANKRYILFVDQALDYDWLPVDEALWLNSRSDALGYTAAAEANIKRLLEN